ncbi:MAG: DEAD/DEAH box helicase [Bacteroidales bacterium]|nr:DEAD/DEAH box helicase [Bacteroidales bacterium]
MKFDALNLDARLRDNINALEYRRMTDIQYKAFKPIMQKDDVLAVAQTGTGKTAAFGIPTIQRLLEKPQKHQSYVVRCVVMEPTHELAHQVGDVLKKLANGTDINTYAIYGGVSQEDQIESLKRGTDIIVATPGRLFDLAAQGYIDVSACEILILDEADQMLALGFIKDIRQLCARLPKRRQTLFFSATINPEIKKLAYSLVVKPVNIRISPKNAVAKNVTHAVLKVKMDEKRFYLERIRHENPDASIMVFVRTRVRAERVAAAMKRVGIDSVSIHGDNSQKERNTALETFRKHEVTMLIATDVSARGIDIPHVNYVVNYDVPDVVENYVHRVGRTGRGMDKGYALTFCAPEEEELLAEVEEYLGGKIDEMKLSREDREATIDFSEEASDDWKSLINKEISKEEKRKGKRKC